MSGRGLFSVRVSKPIMEQLQFTAQQGGLTDSEFARNVVPSLAGLTGDQIRQMPEPDTEGMSQRLSFYLGDEKLRILNSAADTSGLSPSSVLRRVLNASLSRNPISLAHPWERKPLNVEYFFGIVLLSAFVLFLSILTSGTASTQQKRSQ